MALKRSNNESEEHQTSSSLDIDSDTEVLTNDLPPPLDNDEVIEEEIIDEAIAFDEEENVKDTLEDVLVSELMNMNVPLSLASGIGASDFDEPRQRYRSGIPASDTSAFSIPDDFLDELSHADGTGHKTGILTELEVAGRSLGEIVQMDEYRRRIAKDYQRFLTTFVDEHGHSVYYVRIRDMCAANRESLEVNYMHLVESNAFLAKLVANHPIATLAIFDEATMRIVLRLFEEYDRIRAEVHVRITDFPALDNLRDLRYNHLNTMIRVSGVVTRRSGVFPQLKTVKYDCGKCGAVLGPFIQDLNTEIRINSCSTCQSHGPFTVNAAQTVYRNYQKITLQESPGSVPAGRLPRHKECILLWDLIDMARPGEHIDVIGIYRNNFSYQLNTKNGFPVFATIIEVNSINRRDDQFGELHLTDDDIKELYNLAADPMIGTRIIRSIAPSIYGHQDIKTAIALALFGGQSKNVQGKHSIRGDINVLLLGDPGTAKSQFLKYVEKTSHRAVFTTGQGASAVGLTASVRKDHVTREWTLEGGALVLADKGVCCIDEFDKMNDADRTSIHEAMEQQSISISKAGIVTTLQARCAVIAAANPTRGRYNASLPFGQNVNLTEPILSRFDVLCVVRDLVDPMIDERLARFVIGSHIRARGGNSTLADDLQTGYEPIQPIPQELLRKYILYARTRTQPTLSTVDVDKVSRLYAELRRESLAAGSIPITVRHIESIVRMSEAHARMHLRDTVRADDIDLAIRVALESFISSQKYSVMNHLKKAFARYITFRRDTAELLFFVLQELSREALRYSLSSNSNHAMIIPLHDFEMRAKEVGVHDCKPFFTTRLFTDAGWRLQGNHLERTLPQSLVE